jgi:hypothetical protein
MVNITVVLKSEKEIFLEFEDNTKAIEAAGAISMVGLGMKDEDGNNIIVPSDQISYINMGEVPFPKGFFFSTEQVIKKSEIF